MIEDLQDNTTGVEDEVQEEQEKKEMDDLRRWKKSIYHDIENKRQLRLAFPSRYIPNDKGKDIRKALLGVKTKAEAKTIFDRYLDKDVRSAYKLLNIASAMRKIENSKIQ